MEEYPPRPPAPPSASSPRAHYRDNKQASSTASARITACGPAVYRRALGHRDPNFGKQSGGYDLVTALATLAYDGRRSDYFRAELISALKILDEGDVEAEGPEGLVGGALRARRSSCRPASSSSRKTATTTASATSGRTRPTSSRPPPSTSRRTAGSTASRGAAASASPRRFRPRPRRHRHKTHARILAQRGRAHALQGRKASRSRARTRDRSSSPTGEWATPAYIVYDNYRVILKWNRSTWFATAVGVAGGQGEGLSGSCGRSRRSSRPAKGFLHLAVRIAGRTPLLGRRPIL